LLRRERRQDGSRIRNPQVVAEVLVRIGQSLLLTPESVVDLDSVAAVRRFARNHLLPIVLTG
jgi:CO dehydrogenase/acetyl-CoA synthase epsilon subunit